MKRRYLLVISFLLVIIDQVIKSIIIQKMDFNQSISVIKNFFSLTLIKNEGVAFGLLDKMPEVTFTLSFCIVIIIFIEVLKKKNFTKMQIIYISMIVGGAIGNLIDRLRYSVVIDYLDFKIFGYNFPIFNFADTLIVIGVIIYIIDIFRGEKNDIR